MAAKNPAAPPPTYPSNITPETFPQLNWKVEKGADKVYPPPPAAEDTTNEYRNMPTLHLDATAAAIAADSAAAVAACAFSA